MAKKHYSIQDLRRVFDRAIERKALFRSTSNGQHRVRINEGDDLIPVDAFFDQLLRDLDTINKMPQTGVLDFFGTPKHTPRKKRKSLKDLSKVEVPKTLKKEQKEAARQMLAYLCDKEEGTYFTLKGYAGTGKTFTVTKVMEAVLKEAPKTKIALTAPTNKAVKVLSNTFHLENDNVQFATIHSLLGLKPVITEKGEEKFEIDKGNQKKIHQIDLLVLDEVSMLNTELFEKLMEEEVKIIFMGDPAQIPPVHEEESIPLNDKLYEQYKINSYELTTIHRQGRNHPIKELGYLLRTNIEQKKGLYFFSQQFKNDKKLRFYDKGIKAHQDAVLKILNKWFDSKSFEADADYAKVIAWTNRSVMYYNDLIRRIIYKADNLPKIMEGEKLIVDRPYMYDENTLFTTNDEMDVVAVEVDKVGPYKQYYLSIMAQDPVTKERFRFDGIPVLHEDSQEQFDKDQQELANKAKKFLAEDEKKKAAKVWREFFSNRDQFCWIKHNYAITCHKSQGSTYKHVLLCEYDILKNQKLIERNRIRYTAATRASGELVVLL